MKNLFFFAPFCIRIPRQKSRDFLREFFREISENSKTIDFIGVSMGKLQEKFIGLWSRPDFDQNRHGLDHSKDPSFIS
jgi:hypothetical protein